MKRQRIIDENDVGALFVILVAVDGQVIPQDIWNKLCSKDKLLLTEIMEE